MMTTKSVYIGTYGCQMNERDSEEVLGMLTAQGYEISPRAEEADVILLNTCSVRAHAEDRAFGKMGELSELKTQRPELVLGIIGCMAKLQQEAIFKRLPRVDLIAGPAEIYDLPYLLAEVQEKRQRVMAVGRPVRPLERKPTGDYHAPGVRAFVTIMEGCDKACTYCIVPKTRGQEISRSAEEIIAEINALAAAGYQEVTLLGQNVNSYGKRFPDGSGYKGPLGRLRLLQEEPEKLLDFPQLLRMIDASLGDGRPRGASERDAEGGIPEDATGGHPVARIRFTTSHPFDANERLFAAMRDCESVCEWLHLPVQSGSDRILRAMRRGYTARAYLEKIELLRRLVPDISLSTDIIVGFPGETDEDFQATARLMEQVRYDSVYIFKYSPRPGTDAAAREDDVPQDVKDERNQALLALQERIERERFPSFEGSVTEVLIEGPGKVPGQWFGRTRGNYGVILEDDEPLAGQTVTARITRGVPHTLFGEKISGAGGGPRVAQDASSRGGRRNVPEREGSPRERPAAPPRLWSPERADATGAAD